MSPGQPPPDPPAAFVWVDARRIESIEASLDRLTLAGANRAAKDVTLDQRLFNILARLERVEEKLKLLDGIAAGVDRLLKLAGDS